jgi:lactam utilization protein B
MTTYYKQIKKHRKDDLEQSILYLERLANANKDRVHYLSQEAYKLGIMYAIRQIEGTELLHIKAHKELPYSNPKEAEREHKNLVSTLAVLKSILTKRYEGKP